MKSEETYPIFKWGAGGAGGEKTVICIQGARRVEQDILSAFRCEIMRMSLADKGHVNVWKGRTVGADGTVKLLGSWGR